MVFRELVDQRYRSVGFGLTQSLAKVHLESGVSMRAAWAAYHGTRVLPETARKLTLWAAQFHHVDIDEKALLVAPRKRAKAGATHGDKAATHIAEAVRVGLPIGTDYEVTLDCKGGWRVRVFGEWEWSSFTECGRSLEGVLAAVAARLGVKDGSVAR